MTKTFDELMKVLEEKGTLSEEDGKKIIAEHGALTEDEKKDLAAAIKMRKALASQAAEKDGDKRPEGADSDKKAEVSMDEYLQALSVLDSDSASAEDKEKAKKTKEQFESQ
jgi:hypothetical protein